MNITGPVNITFPLIHGDCLTTAEAGRCNLLPCQASPSGFPLGGFRSPSSASRMKMALPSDMPDVIMTLVSYFCGLPGLARKARKHYQDTNKGCLSKSQFTETMWRHSLLMPPGKKTKNTLACVFTVANVLGTWQRHHRPLLIYRLHFYIILYYIIFLFYFINYIF